ncbi:sulfite oxidase-like [Daphnia carinata]|uniref:sulfite oxidase-like n=1 Tax=Daphnia carinata TaxID=120202 RepID=UPI00257AF039|nr:sulfite oxidase-like [Daphnia carinata]
MYSRILINPFHKGCVIFSKCLTRKPPANSSWVRTLSQGTQSSNSHDFHEKDGHGNARRLTITGLGAITLAGLYYYYKKNIPTVWAHEKKESEVNTVAREPGSFVDGLPVYTSDDVAKHRDESTGIWISYKSGVYDITPFIKIHPGGDTILLGAGGSVEPFWSLYAIHQQPGILALMEEYRIGNLTKGEEHLAMANMDDPYANDPRRHPALVVRTKKPFNAETPGFLLVESFITPTDIFYVRHHFPVPDVDPSSESYSLEVVGLDEKDSLNLNLDQLKTAYAPHTVTAVLQCTGNRRSEMNRVKPTKGLEWGQGAIGNAVWKGARLRDVLLAVGVTDSDENENWHVRFDGLDTDPTSAPYAISIPLTKAMDPRGDVILAYEMNGEQLTRDHGFPLRVIIPGTTGARWVKWLTRIEVSKNECESHWQQFDYKSFNPSTEWDKVDFSTAPAIQEMPVTSVVCDPHDGEKVKLKDGKLNLRGYAWSGGGRGIVRVDVSVDLGKTWHVAQLIDSVKVSKQWAWTRWQANLPVQTKETEVWVRAVDSSYNTQPEGMEHLWNMRGVLAVGYHKIKVSVDEN